VNAVNGHALLLRSICDLLPPADADRIAALDPTDYVTFVEAYCAVRQSPALRPELKADLVATIFELMDVEIARVVEERSSTGADPAPVDRSALVTGSPAESARAAPGSQA
jgi:hypothetical protein